MEISQKSEPRPALHTVFLDRDGVINRKLPEGSYVTSWREFDVLPGVPDAIRKLNSAGLRVLILTNQRGIALGLYTTEEVQRIHSELLKLLSSYGASIDGFYFCPHDKGECACRKPLSGLFEQARSEFPDISAKASVMIGDSLSDIEFGQRLGMRTIFIEGDPSRQKPNSKTASALADQRYPSLKEAVDSLLGDQESQPAVGIRHASIQ